MTTTTTSSSSSSSSSPCILVTGGCGYIGSHTITCLLQSPRNYRVVVIDNLVNASAVSLDRVCEIVGLTDNEERSRRLMFHNIDLTNEEALKKFFEISPKFDGCIHFAGLKAVGESAKIPITYYHNNITGTLHLLSLLSQHNCHNIVFSSSATVYGAATTMPLTETTPVDGAGITNPYGRTKYMIEEILRDVHASDPERWNVCILRYFNPVGAHPSGLIGEDPNGIPNNLMPYVSQVAIGRREFLTVFGDDYETADGTGVRDYLHVMDLADGHLKAIDYLETTKKDGGVEIFNLGTGNGYSVLDMVKAMEKACGHEVKYKIGKRREGDIPICYANADKAKNELGWEACRNLDEMCTDLWAWQSKNPSGYPDA